MPMNLLPLIFLTADALTADALTADGSLRGLKRFPSNIDGGWPYDMNPFFLSS